MDIQTIFNIVPYEAIDGVNFESAPEDVANKWGQPEKARVTRLNELEETRGDTFWRYAKGKLVEVSFGKHSKVKCFGLDLLHDKEVLEKLLEHDNAPVELHGFLVFFKLGLALTGVHDGDDSQLAATAFVRGRWDRFKDKMQPWKKQ